MLICAPAYTSQTSVNNLETRYKSSSWIVHTCILYSPSQLIIIAHLHVIVIMRSDDILNIFKRLNKTNAEVLFFFVCFSCGRMQLTFGLTCSTTMSCSIRTDWTRTECRERHRSAHYTHKTKTKVALLKIFLLRLQAGAVKCRLV